MHLEEPCHNLRLCGVFRETVGLQDGESVLGVIRAEQVAVHIAEHLALRRHAVHVEGESLYLAEILLSDLFETSNQLDGTVEFDLNRVLLVIAVTYYLAPFENYAEINGPLPFIAFFDLERP